MKIFDGYNESGDLIYFEVPNSGLSRKAAISIIKNTSGVEIIKEDLKDDFFCQFRIGDKIFEIWEPWGDNSRFHIGAKKAEYSKELELLKESFFNHKQGFLSMLLNR